VTGDKEFDALLTTSTTTAPNRFFYALEVYVDNFMSIIIPTSQEQLVHAATTVMTGIHNVFPANIVDGEEPILEKKMLKGEGQYLLFKMLLGFDFNRKRKTMWLEEEKWAKLLTTLHSWLEPGTSTTGSHLLNSNQW
jgi:hypothetical protein